MRDTADSRHLGLETVRGEIYLGWADQDDTAPPETVPIMREALESAQVPYVLDLVTDAEHGYAPPGGRRYHRRASERHWERGHSLLRCRVLH